MVITSVTKKITTTIKLSTSLYTDIWTPTHIQNRLSSMKTSVWCMPKSKEAEFREKERHFFTRKLQIIFLWKRKDHNLEHLRRYVNIYRHSLTHTHTHEQIHKNFVVHYRIRALQAILLTVQRQSKLLIHIFIENTWSIDKHSETLKKSKKKN